MADHWHLFWLQQGAAKWNEWRQEDPSICPDLSGANLSGAQFVIEDIMGEEIIVDDLSEVDLSSGFFYDEDIDMKKTLYPDLRKADLSGADLSGANLTGQDLSYMNLSHANLSGANLSRTLLVGTNFTSATLTDCIIYGIAAWNVQLEHAIQKNLIITSEGEATITVDNLKVAQFIYLMLNNKEIRDVIDMIAKKAVLILGRFTPERKPVLEALRTALRAKGYSPILFDFDKPSSQDLTETVSVLAHLSRFIIADLTDPSCSPYEVGMIANNHVKPLQPLFHPTKKTHHEFAMLKDLQQRYYWILPTHQYRSSKDLLVSLQNKVIEPAERKLDEITLRRKAE